MRNGQKKKIQRRVDDIDGWVVDHDDEIRLGYGRRHTKITYKARMSSKNHFKTIHTRDAYVGLDNQRSSLNHLAFEIDAVNFEAEKQRLEARGLTVRTREFPHMQAKGLFFEDPEGNVIELICHYGIGGGRTQSS